MKKYKIELKWAFIYATMFLVWMLLEKLAGLHDKHLDKQQFVGVLILIPSICIYVFAIKDKKKNYYPGTITYKQSFKSGFMLTIFMVLLSPLNQLITCYIITPRYFDNLIEHTVSSGLFTREQAEAQFNIKSYILTGIVAGLVTGAAFSAVISFFTRSKK